ncbi:MAG: DDE-type integrase/transposase/recombinase [Burkholderiales bacterium]|nr:DDE-type integrase/transposase/recombinase [Burkholderiales bacterium]
MANSGVIIELRQSKYLNNLIEQDHRAIKRIVRPMLGFKTSTARADWLQKSRPCTWSRRDSSIAPKGDALSAADQFNLLAV